MTEKTRKTKKQTEENPYAVYFQSLDTPTVILNNERKVVWKNESAKELRHFARKGSSIDKILDKQHRKTLKKMLPGDTVHMVFLLDEPTQGFVKRHTDCYVLRISRYNGAVIKILDSIFSQRYYAAQKIGDVYRKYPETKLPYSKITAKRVDRLASIFEGVYTPYLKFHYLSSVLIEFAQKAECALPGAEITFKDVLPLDLLLAFDPKDVYLALSAMLVIIFSFDNSIKNVVLTQYESNGNGIITVICPAVGFAKLISDVYTSPASLLELCEYGENYLSLAIISLLCDKNGWQFAISEDDSQTSLYLWIDIPEGCTGDVQLMSENENDTYFIDVLLSPFKERFNTIERPSDN